MIRYKPNRLYAVPQTLEKRLEIVPAITSSLIKMPLGSLIRISRVCRRATPLAGSGRAKAG